MPTKPAEAGYNSAPTTQEMLKNIIQRIEKLDEEREDVVADIRQVYLEAKGNGFDAKAIREIIKKRKQDAADREEHEAVVLTYMRALGMTPELDD